MLNEYFMWTSIVMIVVAFLSAVNLNRSIKKMRVITDIVVKDHQYQIDRLDIRVGFIEQRHQFKCECMSQEINVPPKRRPGRPKKEIQHKTDS